MDFGGRGGIRTHGTLAGTPVFKTGSLNHSDTLPSLECKHLAKAAWQGKGLLPLLARQVRDQSASSRAKREEEIPAIPSVDFTQCVRDEH